MSSGSVCRSSAGTCDVAEACDGSLNTCPADAFVSSAGVARRRASATWPRAVPARRRPVRATRSCRPRSAARPPARARESCTGSAGMSGRREGEPSTVCRSAAGVWTWPGM
jgi:hypothetical protein